MVKQIYKMLSREEAIKDCDILLEAFSHELNITKPKIQNNHLWGSYCIETSEYNGYVIEFSPFYRHSEQGDFLWDITDPDWREGWHNYIEIIYRKGEIEHPDCDYCECSLEESREIITKDDARKFAEEIRLGIEGDGG